MPSRKMLLISVIASFISTVALPVTLRVGVFSIALNGALAREGSESAVPQLTKVHGTVQEECKDTEDSSNNSDKCNVQKAAEPNNSKKVSDDYPSRPVAKPWNPRTVQDLHREYHNIFKNGNRNAASHLWASFILDRSVHLKESTLEYMFAGFCAVSGSPVNPSDFNRYGLNTRYVPGHPDFGESRFWILPLLLLAVRVRHAGPHLGGHEDNPSEERDVPCGASDGSDGGSGHGLGAEDARGDF